MDEEEEITHPSQFWDGKPPTSITLRLVMEKSLTQAQLLEYDALDEEEALTRIQAVTSIHLQWLGLSEISGLEAFDNAEVLCLQANRIERIENLEWLPRLQFLALQCNRIAVVENLTCLSCLEVLDLSRNVIVDFEAEELPKTLNILNFRGNVCVEMPGYKSKVLHQLPDLDLLDGEEVRPSAVPGPGPTVTVAADKGATVEELLLKTPGPNSGLGAYWMRKDLYAGVTADVKEYIDAYSMEALADDFGQKALDAAQRSRARREANPLPTPAGLDGFIQS